MSAQPYAYVTDDNRHIIFADQCTEPNSMRGLYLDAPHSAQTTDVASVALPPLPQTVDEALEFYAESIVHWITFERSKRETSLQYHRTSPDWEEIGEDPRGHEQFIVTTAKAEKALSDLRMWRDQINEVTTSVMPPSPVDEYRAVAEQTFLELKTNFARDLVRHLINTVPASKGCSADFDRGVQFVIDHLANQIHEERNHDS